MPTVYSIRHHCLATEADQMGRDCSPESFTGAPVFALGWNRGDVGRHAHRSGARLARDYGGLLETAIMRFTDMNLFASGDSPGDCVCRRHGWQNRHPIRRHSRGIFWTFAWKGEWSACF